jgi:serine/threonine protein kinase
LDKAVKGKRTHAAAGQTQVCTSFEKLNGGAPHKSDDVYSVAVLAYELLNGKHPYSGLSATDAVEQNVMPDPVPSLTPGQWRALEKGLALGAENRTASIEEFARGF